MIALFIYIVEVIWSIFLYLSRMKESTNINDRGISSPGLKPILSIAALKQEDFDLNDQVTSNLKKYPSRFNRW